MTTETFVLKAAYARRMPDPNFGQNSQLQHHILLVNTRDLPPDLPLEANARRPNTRKQVYREVRASLLDETGEAGSFHLKNKGIVIVAESVSQKPGTTDQFLIKLNRTSQGILDGGHTYKLIMDAQTTGDLPEEQFVFVHVRTGVPNDWIADISRGLNTSVQVQDMSLYNLAGQFTWLKDELKGQHYYSEIAWSENDDGAFSARDVIALMYLFNIKQFPSSESHPIAGYEKKSEALRVFEDDAASFKLIKPILKDILYLHDWMSFTAAPFYNKGAQKLGAKGRGGGLSFVRAKKEGQKPFAPIFMDGIETFESRLEDAALYPILAGFRVFVEQDPTTGKMQWIGGFNAVKHAWQDLAYELIRATYNTAQEVGRAKNAIGKSRLHWDGVYQKVENYKLKKLSLAMATAVGA